MKTVSDPPCGHCGDPVDAETRTHWDGICGHDGLCCDCQDLSCGMSLAQLNEERSAKGKASITKPWPGFDEHGNKLPT